MLPPHLRSTYKQYKEGTDRIATWLAVTAKALGFDVLNRTSEMKTVKRKKQTSGPASYTIPIKDFTTLASHIVEHIKAPSKVSQAVLGVITRAIQARKDSNEWFQENEQDATSDDDGHAHFVRILEQVHATLQPHSLPKADTEAQEDLNLKNMFAGLQLEDVSEDFEKVGAQSVPSSVSDEKIVVRAQQMKQVMKLPFAAFALLSDMNRIRTFVQELWRKYLAGHEDLISVSVTADYAIDLVRRLEEDFFAEFPKETPKTVLTSLFEMKSALMDISGVHKEEGSRESWHPVMRSTVEWMFYDIHEHLSFLAKAFPSKKGAIVPYRPYPRSMFRNVFIALDDSPFIDRSEDEKADLINMFQECRLLTSFTQTLPVEDELLKGVRYILKTKSVPLWTVFAFRSFLDVRSLMGSFLEVPFKQLQIVATRAKQSVQAAASNRKGCLNESWPFQKDMTVRRVLIHTIEQWVLTDGYDVLVKRHMPNANFPKEDFRILRQHPLLCGLMAFNVHLMTLNCGLAYVNAWGSGMFMAHLYNALRQKGTCQAEWADMESFMNTHESELLFSNGRPDTISDFYKRFELCMGAPLGRYASEKSRDSQFKHFKRKKGGARLLKEAGRVSKALKPRYCAGGFELPTDADVRAVWDHEVVARMLNARLKAARDEPVPSANATQLSLVDLPSAMQVSIGQELKYVTFDYYSFHCTCWSIMRTIEQLCRPRLLECLEGDYTKDLGECNLPWVIGYILKMEARAQSDVSVGHPRAKLAGLNVQSRVIFPLVGQFMSQILDGPHVTLTRELDKVTNAKLLFDKSLVRKKLVSTPKAVSSESGNLKPPREHPTMHMWVDQVAFGYTDYQKEYFPHLVQQSLERMAGRSHSHLEPDGTRTAWFDGTDDNLKCGIMNKASAPYLAEDRAFYASDKNVRYHGSEDRKKALEGLF